MFDIFWTSSDYPSFFREWGKGESPIKQIVYKTTKNEQK